MGSTLDLSNMLTAFFFINTLSWINCAENNLVLVPVLLVNEDQENQLDNHTTQLSIPVSLHNSTVVVAGQEIEPEEPININILVPLQLNSPEGKTLSSTVVTTEARVIVLESRVMGAHFLRLQLLVTSIDSRDVVPLTIPEVRIFLRDDGTERNRTYQLLKPEHSHLILPQDNESPLDDALAFIPYIPTTDESQIQNVDSKTLLFKTKDVSQIQTEIYETSVFCRGCPTTGCLRPDPLLCVQLPPAMRLAICAVLFCLAAFLLMLFVHVFILRPSHSSVFSATRYARNLRTAWAYAPLISDNKEPRV